MPDADAVRAADEADEAGPVSSQEGRDAPDPLVGTTISGRYKIESSLGEGGMGVVYLAEHTLMHKRLAVKVLHPEMMRLPEVVARFEREAMAAAHIEHPNVAAATDFGKLEDGSFFLVLEYVQGRSLRDMVADGPIAPERAVHIATQIASALARAHGLGIVHRDMKPENVMLVARDGDPDFVKVLDFGIAKVPVAEIIKDASAKSKKALTQLGMVYGTPEYMAPEQALGQDVDARADIYALGVILYEMITGLRPFEADSPVTLLGMQVTHAPPSFADRSPLVTVPAPLEELVMKMLEKEASKRPSDAREVVDSLDQIRLALHLAANPRLMGSSPSYSELTPAQRLETGTARTAINLAAPTPALATTNALARLAPLVTRGQDTLRGLWQKLEPVADGAMEKLRTHLPAAHQTLQQVHGSLPTPMRRVPVFGWLGMLAGSALLVLLLGIVLLCSSPRLQVARSAFAVPGASASGSSSAPVSQAPTKATDEQIKEASAKGPEAVEQLIARFPKDTDLLKVLGRSYMAANQPDKALETYKTLLAADPKASEEIELGQNVVLACQNEATSDAAYAMLESDMAARGPDLLYWLAYESKAASKYMLKAARSLAKKDVRERATPALQIALELRAATSCEGKYKLLERARTDGDKRSLLLLQPLFHTKGCGFLSMGDCWKCMRRGPALANAVKEIEARSSTSPP
ncbi:MAG: protein kinase [Deltaproteobacteria bacterium]|nr:protein kinase [Deltaproteobacteria bacterium]